MKNRGIIEKFNSSLNFLKTNFKDGTGYGPMYSAFMLDLLH